MSLSDGETSGLAVRRRRLAAAVILTPSRSRITSPSELKSWWLMDAPGSDDLVAMLKHQGVDYFPDDPVARAMLAACVEKATPPAIAEA